MQLACSTNITVVSTDQVQYVADRLWQLLKSTKYRSTLHSGDIENLRLLLDHIYITERYMKTSIQIFKTTF